MRLLKRILALLLVLQVNCFLLKNIIGMNKIIFNKRKIMMEKSDI